MEKINLEQIAELVKSVVSAMEQKGYGSAVCENPDDAVAAVEIAQKKLLKLDVESRRAIIQEIRDGALAESEKLAAMELAETGMGRLEDKVFKICETIKKTPGIENIYPEIYSGSNGVAVVEKIPFGVFACVLPSTAPAATVIHNSICMIASGNGAVFCPHPNASKTAAQAVEIVNQAVIRAGGPAHLLAAIQKSSVENTNLVMQHEKVQAVLVTGGLGVVKAAFQARKRAFCAGPGNPPVLVDGTTDIAKAAQFIFAGNSFENCINCIGEKEVFVLRQHADELIDQLIKCGSYLIRDAGAIERLRKMVTTETGASNRKYVGKNASLILKDLGIQVGEEVKLIIFETAADHDFVKEEYLMPLLPIVRVDSVDQGINWAVKAEGGRRHSSIIHSNNIETVTKFINALRTTVVAVNSSSFSGVGMGGEGFVTMSIAGTTGEGLTSPSTFTRVLRRTFVNGLGQYVVL